MQVQTRGTASVPQRSASSICQSADPVGISNLSVYQLPSTRYAPEAAKLGAWALAMTNNLAASGSHSAAPNRDTSANSSTIQAHSIQGSQGKQCFCEERLIRNAINAGELTFA